MTGEGAIKKKKKYLVLLLLMYLVGVFLLLTPDFPIGGNGDELFLLGRSISSGQGYRDIYFPGCPSHTKHPFVYPLILAFGQFIFGENVVFLKLISVFFGVGSLIFIYLFFRRKISFFCLFFVLFFTASNPWFLVYSTSFAPEMPYLFFSFLMLIVFEKLENQKKFLPILVFLLVIVFFTRSIGLSLFIATVFYFILKKEYRNSFFVLGLFILFVFPWMIRNELLSAYSVSKPYTQQFVKYLSDMDIFLFGKIIIKNILGYPQQIIFLFLPGGFMGVEKFCFIEDECFPLAHSLMNNLGIFFAVPISFFISFLISGLLSIVIIVGLFLQFKEKYKKLVLFYIFFYLAISILFPKKEAYQNVRYLFPLLPFFIYYAIRGGKFLIYISKKNFYFLKYIGMILIGLFYIYYNLIPIAEIIYNNTAYLRIYKRLSMKERKDYKDHWNGEHFKTARWVEQNTLPNAVFISDWPPAFYLYNHRKGIFFQCIPYWPDKKTWKEIKNTFRKEVAGYLVVKNEEEETLLRKLDSECKELVFIPLLIIFEPEAFYTDNENKIYKIMKVKQRVKLIFKKGMCAIEKEDYRGAILEFEKVVNITPDFFAGYYFMGFCYEQQGFLDQACLLYKKTIVLQPNYEIAKNRLAILEQERVMKERPNEAKEYLLLGSIYLKNYDFLKAISSFKKTMELNPNLPECYYNLGIAYAYKQRFGLAILYFKKLLQMDCDLIFKAKHQIKVNQRRRIIWQDVNQT